MQGYSLSELAACLGNDASVDLGTYRRLVVFAERHAVGPLLREQVLAGLPPDHPARPPLHDAALREAALEARRNARVARCIEALARAGVPSLLFKGTAVAHTHYARPELRPRDDTDLLIRRDHLDTADRVLTRQGFGRIPGNEGPLIMRQRLYRRTDGDGVLHNLDLHWRVTNDPRGDRFDPRALMAASRSLEALGVHARAPSDGDALLLACLHLDAHHAGDVRLIWLCDVDRLVRALSAAGRERVDVVAQTRGLTSACAWVLAAAREAFGTPLAGFEPLLDSSTTGAPSGARGARWLRDLSRLDDSAQRVGWLAQHLFPPAEYLRQRFASGAPAWWLGLRRVLHGIRRLVQR